MAAQQQRFFEETGHAIIYATYRPKPPQKLADRIINHLKTKVLFIHRTFNKLSFKKTEH